MKININNKTMTNVLLSLSLLCLALAITTVANAKPNNNEIKDRLELLSQQLEKKRQEFHIPGMAIAIVKDNKMIFSKVTLIFKPILLKVLIEIID